MNSGVCCILTLVLVMYCHAEWSFDRPVVYKVYNANKTWNEAKEVCRATNNSMLAISNDTIWQFWLAMFNPDSSIPFRTTSRFWFGLHSTNPLNLSELFWDDCSIPDFIEWTINRPLYFPEYPCLAFDVDHRPFSTVLMKLWMALPCNDQLRFICAMENDCIHRACDEFIIVITDAVCSTACAILHSTGDLADLLSCRSRAIPLADFTVCHVYKTPMSVTPVESFSICYKPDLTVPLSYCNTTTPALDLNAVVDTSPVPNSTCRINGHSTDTTAGVFRTTTNIATLCECPCSSVDDTTDTPLSIQQKVENLKKDLAIDKKQTSNSKRKLISVSDNRPSAKGLGVFGLVILIVVPTCIILIDLTSLSQHCKYFWTGNFPKINKHEKEKKIEESRLNMGKEISVSRIGTAYKKRTNPQSHTNIKLNEPENETKSVSKNVSAYPTNSDEKRPQSVLFVRPKTPINPKTKVIYKDILDIKYQPSMMTSRIIANDIKMGKRKLHDVNVSYKGKDIGQDVRIKSSKNRTIEEVPWINML